MLWGDASESQSPEPISEESDLDVYEEDEAEDKVYCYCHRVSAPWYQVDK